MPQKISESVNVCLDCQKELMQHNAHIENDKNYIGGWIVVCSECGNHAVTIYY